MTAEPAEAAEIRTVLALDGPSAPLAIFDPAQPGGSLLMPTLPAVSSG